MNLSGARREILEVGELEVDLDKREIRRGGDLLELQPRVFDLFAYLIEQRDRIVPKRELLEAVWSGQLVVPDVLSTAFYSLRRALNDDSQAPKYVRTVHRVGYQLIADVSVRAARSRFPAADARHAAFVGRHDERALFTRMLAASAPTQVLFVHGPPGIGKTTLLQELTYQCRVTGTEYVWLSSTISGPFLEGFVSILASSLGCERTLEALVERLSVRPLVLFVDDLHQILDVGEWLRQELWPRLPASARLVLAGRKRPSLRWRHDGAWSSAASEVELSGLTRDEVSALLAARGVSLEHAPTVWRRTRGHPLALTLSAELMGRGEPPDLFERGEALEALVGWYSDRAVAPLHERAFQLACLFEEITEPMLAALLDPTSASSHMRWLESLSFTQHSPEGAVRVHAFVCEAVIAHLGRTNPSRLADLVQLATRHFIDELGRTTDPAACMHVAQQFIGLGRHHAPLRDKYLSSEAGPECSLHIASATEHPSLLDLVEHHEGARSMELTRAWLKHPRTVVWSVRDTSDRPLGFLVTLRLSLRERLTATHDPVVTSMLSHLAQAEGSRDDDEVLIHRSLLAKDDYQTPSAVTRQLHVAKVIEFIAYGMSTPALAHVLAVYGEPETWEPSATSVGFRRVPKCDTVIDGRVFACFHRSTRTSSVSDWLVEVGRTLVEGFRRHSSATA